MEEKVLIQSQQYNVKKFFVIAVLVGLLLSLAIFAITVIGNIDDGHDDYSYYLEQYEEHKAAGRCNKYLEPGVRCHPCKMVEKYDSELVYEVSKTLKDDLVSVVLPAAVCTVIGFLVYLILSGYSLTVTDKRIYGTAAWGKRVDLPVDSISATATGGFHGVSVSTSSGRISFQAIKNVEAIYNEINNLLLKRQQEKAKPSEVATTIVQQSDEADQLKKYKALLDSGVITQEEFDAKKKQLLGL